MWKKGEVLEKGSDNCLKRLYTIRFLVLNCQQNYGFMVQKDRYLVFNFNIKEASLVAQTVKNLPGI